MDEADSMTNAAQDALRRGLKNSLLFQLLKNMFNMLGFFLFAMI